MKATRSNSCGPLQTLRLSASILLLALVVAPRASAGVYELYDITFNDSQGDSGYGQIEVNCDNNNYYTACAGFLDLATGTAAGVWTLYTGGGSSSYPGYLTSPSGAYWYNNAVYPEGNNPQYPNTDVILDLYGLLFTQSNGNEVNLWGNADGTYTLGGNINGWQNFNVEVTFVDPTVIPVPEAPAWLACLFVLIPIGVSAYQVWRRHRFHGVFNG